MKARPTSKIARLGIHLVMASVLAGFAGCSATSTDTSTSSPAGTTSTTTDSSVETSVSSALSAVGQSLQEDASAISSETAALEVETSDQAAQTTPSKMRRGPDLGTGGCSDKDSDVTLTVSCDDVAHTASIIRDFGVGCETENREGDEVVVTGQELIQWTNMGDNSCSSSKNRPKLWKAVQGQGTTEDQLAQRIRSTDPTNPEDPQSAIVRTNSEDGTSVKVIGFDQILYSNATDNGNGLSVHEQVTIPGTSRIKYKSDGTTKIFDHTVSTEVPLEIDVSKPEGSGPSLRKSTDRTIRSGTIALSHNLAKYTVHSAFKDVVYDYNQCECHPVSGTVTITVTDNTTSAEIGSGTVTFNDCDSETVTYNGEAVKLPGFESCR